MPEPWYALKHPDGSIEPATVSMTREGAWSAGFGFVAAALGPEWNRRFWKRWQPSIASARRRGYQIVPVRIVEVRNA